MPFLDALPANAKLAELFALRADLYDPLLQFAEKVMRGPSRLTPGQREMIASYVSGVNACSYCAGGHQAAAVAFGIDEALFESLLDDIDSAPMEETLKPILKYAKKLTETPSRLVQADADAVLAAGWDEETLTDVVHVCALFNMLNRLVDGHGIIGIPEDFKARGELHAKVGYVKQYEHD